MGFEGNLYDVLYVVTPVVALTLAVWPLKFGRNLNWLAFTGIQFLLACVYYLLIYAVLVGQGRRFTQVDGLLWAGILLLGLVAGAVLRRLLESKTVSGSGGTSTEVEAVSESESVGNLSDSQGSSGKATTSSQGQSSVGLENGDSSAVGEECLCFVSFAHADDNYRFFGEVKAGEFTRECIIMGFASKGLQNLVFTDRFCSRGEDFETKFRPKLEKAEVLVILLSENYIAKPLKGEFPWREWEFRTFVNAHDTDSLRERIRIVDFGGVGEAAFLDWCKRALEGKEPDWLKSHGDGPSFFNSNFRFFLGEAPFQEVGKKKAVGDLQRFGSETANKAKQLRGTKPGKNSG